MEADQQPAQFRGPHNHMGQALEPRVGNASPRLAVTPWQFRIPLELAEIPEGDDMLSLIGAASG